MSALAAYGASELAPTAVDLGVAVGKAIGTAAIAKGREAYTRRQRGRSVSRSRSRSRNKTNKHALRDLGQAAGHNESKRTDEQSPPTSISNKELEFVPLIKVEKNTNPDETITKRARDTLLHKGVKICFACKNIRKEPILLNWAVVLPKAINGINSSDILRGDNVEREEGVTSAQTFMDLRCLPINKDRYEVIMHQTHTILPDSDKGTGNATGRDLKIIEEYVKTNRQIFFDGSTALPLQNMYMIWWVDYYGSPTGVKTLTADVSWKKVNYFKEVN